MSWTYSGDPSSSAKDEVRFLVGDTDEGDPLLRDAEVTYAINQTGGVITAAIRCCELIMSKFSRLADESIGPLRIDYSQKAKGYRTMISQLRERLFLNGAPPYAGGISKTDKHFNDQQTDRVRPAFTKNEMHNPSYAANPQQQLDEFLWGIF
jgi:hypothetical protein